MNLVLTSVVLNGIMIGLVSDLPLGVTIAWTLAISLLIYVAYRKGLSEGKDRRSL